MKRRKFVTKDYINKKLFINVFLFIIIIMGIGYASIGTNLNLTGELSIDRYDMTLYGVIRKEAENNRDALQYTGNHNDSYNTVGNKNIYYFHTNDASSNSLLNKTNLIFANKCWIMLRTTDSGGVKLLYNGEPTSDGKCTNNRGDHNGITTDGWEDAEESYYYGSSYTYNETTGEYTLSGTIVSNVTTVPEYYYSCASDTDTTCSTLYLVLRTEDKYFTYTQLYNMTTPTNYASIGKIEYNTATATALTGVGYKTNLLEDLLYTQLQTNQTLKILNSDTMNTTSTKAYFYGDKVIYDNGYYYLLNNDDTVPSQTTWPTTTQGLNDLEGKFTCRSNKTTTTTYNGNTIPNGTKCSYIYYVVNTTSETNKLIYETLKRGDTISNQDIYLSTGINDNNDGTYTLKDEGLATIKSSDWYNDFNNYDQYYICNDYNSKTCSESSLFLIEKAYKTGSSTTMQYSKRAVYAEEIEYVGNEYHLKGNKETLVSWYNNYDKINSKHYVCDDGSETCPDVRFIIYTSNNAYYYIDLESNKSITQVINNHLYIDNVNQMDTLMKKYIDFWYKNEIYPYQSYLETDVTFCNDRRIKNLNGWDPNGGNTTLPLEFVGVDTSTDLSCSAETDKFNMNNTKAALSYPVALLTAPEKDIINNNKIFATGDSYFTMTPYSYDFKYAHGSYMKTVTSNGTTSNSYAIGMDGMRPVISIRGDLTYESGNGSMDTPYRVNTN